MNTNIYFITFSMSKVIMKKLISNIDLIEIKKEYSKTEITTDNLPIFQKNHFKLSHFQIKLIFLYYSLVNSQGILYSYSKSKLAKKLNCCIKTINNNNAILDKLGFIMLNTKEFGKVNLIIPGYYKQCNNEYIIIPKKILNDILESTNINQTRVLIESLLNDSNVV